MVLFESLIALNIIVFVLILIKRRDFLEKFKRLTLFDKIFVSGFLIFSLVSTVISIFFVFRIPFNPFALLPREILSIFLSIFNPFMSLLSLGFAAIKWYFPDYKKTTPKVKTKKFEDKALSALFKSHNVSGSGQLADPYIIESRNLFPKLDVVKIKKSNIHILFRNHDLESIKIKRSSNVVFKNCNYTCLQLYNCSEVKISNCTFNLLDVNKSVKILVQNTKIAYLKIFRSFLNEFENCSIKRIDKLHSPDNIFNLKEQLEDKSRKSNVFQNNLPSIVIFFLVSLITGDILFFSLLTNTANVYSFLIVPFILLFSVLSMVMLFMEAIELQRKLKRYYEGKITVRFNDSKLIVGCALIIVGIILINIFLLLLYQNPFLWMTSETTTIFLLSIIIISSLIITAGINTLIRNIQFFSEQIVRSKNPLYPVFLLYNIFYIIFLTLLFIGGFILSIDYTYLILAPLISIFMLLNIVISIIAKYGHPKLKESKSGIKSIYSMTLIAMVIIINPLLSYNLPYYINSYSILNFPQETFYSILRLVLTLILGLLGIFSFPNLSKLLSAARYSRKEIYDKSIKRLQSALRNEPNNELGLYNLGVTYFNNGEYTKSVETLKKTLSINQNSIPTLIALGYASAELGDFESAIDACEKAIHLFKNPIVSVATKFSDIMKQSLFQPVKEEFAWHALSYVYSVQKKYDKVIETARKAISLNSKFKEAWVTLAHGYNKLGETNKAIEACNRALEVDSNFGYAWSQIGVAYQLKGALDLSLQMLQKAVKLAPKENNIWLILAKLYIELKDYKIALATINISLELKPNYQDAIKVKEEILRLMNNETTL